MADFLQDIQNFQRYGTYDYEFDLNGNLNFNSSSSDFSQVYLVMPLSAIYYNNSKVDTFYDPTFTEFIPTTSSIEITSSSANLQQQLDEVQNENVTLKTQLDSIITQTEPSTSNQLAVQQVILELRKALGQGRVDSDFSTTFPYTPIIKPTA